MDRDLAQTSPLRCLVADDHPALVVALGDFLLGQGYTVVGPAYDGRQALALAEAEKPDLAVIDYRMPRLFGTELVEKLREAVPGLKIAVYTAEAQGRTVTDLLAAGADAIVLKEAPLQDLGRALNAISLGNRYVDPELATAALGQAGRQSSSLTARELDVLRLLAEGLSHEAIGRTLSISAETVRTHLTKACARLDASTRTQAVAAALRLGLIS